MSFFSKAKSAGKYIFIGMPSAIFGSRLLKAGNETLVASYKTLTNPHCPHCPSGVMVCEVDSADETQHVPWRCHACGFGLLASPNVKLTRQLTQQLRMAALKDRLSSLEVAQLQELANNHRKHSRLLYSGAAFTGVGGVYLLASGASLLTSANWLVICGCLFVVGLTKAYRSWQAATGTIFLEGAFYQWLKKRIMVRLILALAAIFSVSGALAAPKTSANLGCVLEAAQAENVPANILLAIFSNENGRAGQWVKNANGSHDLGHFQINTIHWGPKGYFADSPTITKEVVANDGCYNARLAAWLAHRAFSSSSKSDFWARWADYHSRSERYNAIYRKKLITASKKWGDYLQHKHPERVAINYQQ